MKPCSVFATGLVMPAAIKPAPPVGPIMSFVWGLPPIQLAMVPRASRVIFLADIARGSMKKAGGGRLVFSGILSRRANSAFDG